MDFLPAPIIQSTLARISSALASGALAPLRSIAHGLGALAGAFRQMVQATHVGKVVVGAGEAGALPGRAAGGGIAVTGGTGGLGLAMADWAAATHAARHLVLLSRSGRTGEAAPIGLLASPASMTLAAVDASVPADLQGLVCGGVLEGLPITTLLHAAGILRDSLLAQQTADSVRRVLAPKLGPLHALREAPGPLAATLLFSSVASLLGAAGQGNYAAANAALDAWAHAQMASGANATAVQWGAWASSGGDLLWREGFISMRYCDGRAWL